MSAAGYFRKVAELLALLQVTDGDARALALDDGAERAAKRLARVRSDDNKVMLVGNGGSSAIASHMHSDLMKSVGVRALVFHDIPLLTATTNDDGYVRVFADPIARWAEAGDVLVAVSSSGRSANILAAAAAASKAGAELVTLTGFSPDNPLRAQGMLNFYVDSTDYGSVEGAHTLLTHFLTDRARELAS